MPLVREPHGVAPWAAADVQHTRSLGQVACDHPTIDGELDRAVGGIAQSIPLAFAKLRVVVANVRASHARWDYATAMDWRSARIGVGRPRRSRTSGPMAPVSGSQWRRR